MTNKKGENVQVLNGVDVVWDSWLNGFKTLQGFQSEVEEKSLQVFNYQKDLLKSTQKTLRAIEKESSKGTKEWNESLQSRFTTADKNPLGPMYANWAEQLEEINEKMQTLSWSPSHVGLDLLVQSQQLIEGTTKEALKQQQKGRTDTLKSIEGLAGKMKDIQKGLLVSQ